jgi:GT2 family glycosyltransferase
MPRDPLAWQPLLRHWTHCLGAGGTALEELGNLTAIAGLNLAELLPGGPGWVDVQRCLRHDPEGAFRTLYYSLALRGLEPLPAPEHLVPPDGDERPRITVLIPVHNHWPLTLNCLRSLVVAANGTRFEVIVADDASSDATIQLRRQIPWLRIWRSEQNQGFLDTCNGAARLARGELLLLLNNDTLVGDHALDRLWQSLERHPEAAVVGAAVWGADGLPQEVGGIVWADGEVWNHGRGFPPEHWFALAYERQTDYVSGCALAIRRSLWQQLDGFDQRYRPAYCEDTDLCLRVWEAGHTVLVEPQARILHLEGLSHSRSTAAGGLKAHQLGNLQVLRQRWQERLDLLQPPRGMPWLLAADPALRGAAVALVVNPCPDTSSSSIAFARSQGYQPLVLGEGAEPQPGLMGLPLAWTGLIEWLQEQFAPPWCPAAVVVSPPGAAESLVGQPGWQRLGWPQVGHTAELPEPPGREGRMPPALPGWERDGVRLLASSSGLHGDGWLETPSRLVLQLLGRPSTTGCLLLQLYLPEAEAGADISVTVEVKLGSDGPEGRWTLQPGLNCFELALPAQRQSSLVLELEGTVRDQPIEGHDQRRLLAVLADLGVVAPSLEVHGAAATASTDL